MPSMGHQPHIHYHTLLAYYIIILQAVLKALCYIREIPCLNLLPKNGSSDLVILKARAEKHVCELMGELKFPIDLSIGR